MNSSWSVGILKKPFIITIRKPICNVFVMLNTHIKPASIVIEWIKGNLMNPMVNRVLTSFAKCKNNIISPIYTIFIITMRWGIDVVLFMIV